jgi:hypothetical protein
MHDPKSVLFTIPFPWFHRFHGSRMWAPFITVWHVDPCHKGSDDSCGRFMRAHHCDQTKLEKIIKRFEFDWDRVFTSEGSGNAYFCGYFCPNGDPHLSVYGIVLNLFFMAAIEHFGTRKKAMKFMQKNLVEIFLFAENPCDSLSDTINRKWETGCGEVQTPQTRKERIRNMAGSIYAWICRNTRPWYKNPMWHFHHWELQIHPWQKFKRLFIERCSICGKGFSRKESVCGSWSGTQIWHEKCSADQSKPVTVSHNA